jgi:4-deoxy-L-threo-5-hexosulose-uronate ketol-isomerase
MNLYLMADRIRYARMTTAELRSTFLVQDLFQPGTIQLAYTDLDRAVLGGIVPTQQAIHLPNPAELRAKFFLERREAGILNIGGAGTVSVDGQDFALGKLDCLYLGRGAQQVAFRSNDAASPAQFYLLSYPAHAAYPTGLARFAELQGTSLGSLATCNRRTLYKAIHAEGLQSCQLVMGFTLLEEGSNWNTMPPHTHMRRSEVYMYFDLPDANARIVHMMGPPDETRHVLVSNGEVVLSPGWSVHCGVGTQRYGFCWGMGGENQRYDDMDPAPLAELL